MSLELGIVIAALVVIAYGLHSRRFDHGLVTAPMLFMAVGLVLGPLCGWPSGGTEHSEETLKLLAEAALALILFSDASRIDLGALRREMGMPTRLLAVSLPLTIVAGGALAWWWLPNVGLVEALLLGAILAPTDAALGQSVVSSKAVPLRIRQTLNVESGLNDGVALPVVAFFIAVTTGQSDVAHATDWLGYAAAQIGFGITVGLVAGYSGGWLSDRASERDTMNEATQRITAAALVVAAFFGAELIGGNGFISVFVAGLAFGAMARTSGVVAHAFIEAEGHLLMLLVFLLFGATWAVPAILHADAASWGYAVASLTVVRMLPTALSLMGTGLRGPSVLFIGWFGPRGLATVLFALMAMESTHLPQVHTIGSIAMLVVVLSVVAHGLTAAPLASIYGRMVKRAPERCETELGPMTAHPLRRRPANGGEFEGM